MSNIIFVIVVCVIAIVITVFITRWVFRIDTIVKTMQTQLEVLTLMAEKQGVSKADILTAVNRTKEEHKNNPGGF